MPQVADSCFKRNDLLFLVRWSFPLFRFDAGDAAIGRLMHQCVRFHGSHKVFFLFLEVKRSLLLRSKWDIQNCVSHLIDDANMAFQSSLEMFVGVDEVRHALSTFPGWHFPATFC